MKMTLHIDEGLLERVAAVYGCESKTAAVDLALREMERRHKMKSYADRGLGFAASVLRESVDARYDLMASRKVPAEEVTTKSHGRRRAR